MWFWNLKNSSQTDTPYAPSFALRFHSFPDGISSAKNSLAADVHMARKCFGNDAEYDWQTAKVAHSKTAPITTYSTVAGVGQNHPSSTCSTLRPTVFIYYIYGVKILIIPPLASCTRGGDIVTHSSVRTYIPLSVRMCVYILLGNAN